jgi:hypothetical protein
VKSQRKQKCVSDEMLISIYVANITVYADKVKNFVREKVIGRCRRQQKTQSGSLDADQKVGKAVGPAFIALIQETDMTKEEGDEEAQEMCQRVEKWLECWHHQ